MEAIIGILGSTVIEIGKYIGGRHLNYLCCFNSNIKSLRDEAQKLKDANDGLLTRVVVAKNDAQVIYPQVERWLERANQRKDIINGIENDIPKVQKERLNLISRYSLSRKAKKTAEDLKELHRCKFDRISEDAPPAASESRPLGLNEKSKTRKELEEAIIEALRDRDMNMIGLFGTGGIGKTTMAERIMDRVKEEKLFEEAVMVVVSHPVQMTKIQQSIADQLRLTLNAEDLRTRASKIHTRLTTDHMKRILIVVDDVWDSLKLRDLGIPSGNNFGGRCTVLLTSRDRSVLDRMESQKIFRIEMLSETEAWDLFKEKTGDCADREEWSSIARDVAKECKGLPVALVTVGGALRSNTRQELWEDALVQLRRSDPTNLSWVLTDVYKPLKLSYEYLEDPHAKSLFLLCSTFEEDCDIDLSILTWYGMGLGIFEGLPNLNATRKRIVRLVQTLKDRSLLLDGFDEHHAKMHDVVRDMAIYIAPTEQRGGFVINLLDNMLMDWESRKNWYEDRSWILMTNLNSRTEFPLDYLKWPSLHLLMMRNGGEELYSDDELNRFFDGMEEVRVLSMERIRIRSLPPSTQMLKNLKTLCLFECPVLETIGVVGKLLKLEILNCRNCENIEALPTEIGGLKRLRLLETINCENLKRIAPGVISNLSSLEELKLRNSFRGWEAKESNAKENAALAELESLTKLTCLEIEINDLSLVAEEICLPSGIVKYEIAIGKRSYWWYNKDDFSRSMYVKIPGQVNMGSWIKTLLWSTEFLYLEGDGASQVDLVELKKMKSLTLRSCPSMEKLVNTTTSTATSVFPSLESLSMSQLDILKEIIPVGYTDYSCFKNLKRIEISMCPRLRYLFPVSVAIRSLTRLEELTVCHCHAIKDIFCGGGGGGDDMENDGKIISHHLQMAFPKLNSLALHDLPTLQAQKTLLQIAAHAGNLRTLRLTRMKGLFSGLFSNLESIYICNLNCIKNLMSPSMAENLVHLRELQLQFCNVLSEVIGDGEEKEVPATMGRVSLFPRLVILVLIELPELRSLWQWNHRNTTLELPSLEAVHIINCPQMETFTHGSLITTTKP